MPTGDANKPFHAGPWLVQPDLNRLSEGDRVIALEPRSMDLLTCLASQPGKTISADELLETVWHGRAQVDNTIYQAIAHLRKVLGDDARHPRYIETIAKKGYRLICPVEPAATDDDLQASSGIGFGRRYVALGVGIAVATIAIMLTINPELRTRLAPARDSPSDRSVAVLPFVDMSEDGSQQYLGDGVSEELIHVLSNLPDLRVTARTSSFVFRNSKEDIRQIGRKLNVATILEGSIRKDGDRIRVTSQLVDTRTGYHLWSKTFDRDASDLLRIQSNIAAAVATTFESQESGASESDDHFAQTVAMQAYDYYLLGMHYLHKESNSTHPLAIEYFERSIEADPSFARAYAGLSESYGNRYYYERDRGFLDRAESAVDHALLLDDRSADAFYSLGWVRRLNDDYSGAIAAFEKAIELNPNHARAYARLANRYAAQGHDDLAYSMVQKAYELDSMSAEMNIIMGAYQQDWGSQYPYYKRAMEIDPDYPGSYLAVGSHYSSTGQLDKAMPYFRKVVDLKTGPTRVDVDVERLIFAYIDLRDFKSAAETIARMNDLEWDKIVINADIQLQLARGEFSAARNIVHSVLPTWMDNDSLMGLLAFYEMILGDTLHAEVIYSRIAAATKPADVYGNQNLLRGQHLAWGMLGAVNLAHLRRQNGNYASAQKLLRKTRANLELRKKFGWVDGSVQYVRAQIAVLEGNNDAAIEYFRQAVETGWTKAWFRRIDPIMADLRTDARYKQILEKLEDRLLAMRERTQVLASNNP